MGLSGDGDINSCLDVDALTLPMTINEGYIAIMRAFQAGILPLHPQTSLLAKTLSQPLCVGQKQNIFAWLDKHTAKEGKGQFPLP